MKIESLLYKEHPHLFGLTRKAPQLVPNGLTNADIVEYDVDVFLEELEGLDLKTVEASRDNQADNLFQLMYNARRTAIAVFESDMLAALLSTNGQSLERYTGSIGGSVGSGVVDTYPGQEIGLTLKAKPDTGGIMRIKRIGLLLNRDAQVEVSISGIAGSFLVVSSADTPSYFTPTVPLLIDLSKPEPITVSYLAGSFQPKANIISCGCTRMDNVISKYLATPLSTQANGILLDVEMYCDSRNVITRNFDASEVFASVIAYAARFKTGELLIEKIIATGVINRYTMLDRERLWGKRNHYRKEYTDRITWLIGNDGIDTGFSECYPCKKAAAQPLAMGRILI